MTKNLKRISISVDEDDYAKFQELKQPGLSVGFLIREAMSDFLKKFKEK
tara:strand:+ start:284 stop:430 length:147 start_codon:yes stop_codon:yes gene_type:complete